MNSPKKAFTACWIGSSHSARGMESTSDALSRLDSLQTICKGSGLLESEQGRGINDVQDVWGSNGFTKDLLHFAGSDAFKRTGDFFPALFRSALNRTD